MDDLVEAIKCYLGGPRNARYERERADTRIRPQPVDERLRLLEEIIALDLPFGLKLAFNSLGLATYRSKILFPGVAQADPTTFREYLVYGMRSGDVLDCLRIAFSFRHTDPARAAYMLYYLAAFVSPMGTACQMKVESLTKRLAEIHQLNFDPETWEGGADDLGWFVWLDGDRHWIWWPPVREAIDRRLGLASTPESWSCHYYWNAWHHLHVHPRSRHRVTDSLEHDRISD
jgi:hypothetical protein